MVVGWYHSHPGFGCWLSGVDINTQQSFEALSERAVAVVVDPIQSVKGKVRSSVFLFSLFSIARPVSSVHKRSGLQIRVSGVPPSAIPHTRILCCYLVME